MESSDQSLPPPLVVEPIEIGNTSVDNDMSEARLAFELYPDGELRRTTQAGSPPPGSVAKLLSPTATLPIICAFAIILDRSRRAREISTQYPPYLSNIPEIPGTGRVIVPHVFAATAPYRGLVYESILTEEVERVFDSSLSVIRLWASRGPDLAELARSLATPEAGSRERTEYFSFRWIVHNQIVVARALASAVDVDHVSIHTSPDGLATLRWFLAEVVGLIEVTRPDVIKPAGAWYLSANTMVHLNARPIEGSSMAATTHERGRAPNHVCFAVTDLAACAALLDSVGWSYRWDGSFGPGSQLWLRIDGDLVFELQSRGAQP